jgi:hypothetical protein
LDFLDRLLGYALPYARQAPADEEAQAPGRPHALLPLDLFRSALLFFAQQRARGLDPVVLSPVRGQVVNSSRGRSAIVPRTHPDVPLPSVAIASAEARDLAAKLDALGIKPENRPEDNPRTYAHEETGWSKLLGLIRLGGSSPT